MPEYLYGQSEIQPETTLESRMVSLEESEKLAQDLLEQYNISITANINRDVHGWYEDYLPTELFQNAIEHYLELIPSEILEKYWGHGITRGDAQRKLAAALNILANSTIKGDFSRLKNSGFIDAFTHGDFLVIATGDRPIILTEDHKPVLFPEGALFNFGALVVNTRFYSLVDRLRELFPNRTIIKANELPGYLK